MISGERSLLGPGGCNGGREEGTDLTYYWKVKSIKVTNGLNMGSKGEGRAKSTPRFGTWATERMVMLSLSVMGNTRIKFG